MGQGDSEGQGEVRGARCEVRWARARVRAKARARRSRKRGEGQSESRARAITRNCQVMCTVVEYMLVLWGFLVLIWVLAVVVVFLFVALLAYLDFVEFRCFCVDSLLSR